MSEKRYLYRLTHIDNIEHIRDFGITQLDSPNRNMNYESIGDNSLINTRRSVQLAHGEMLSEYIPFYFGYKMPMLFVVQKGFNNVSPVLPKDIVYCVTDVSSIQSSGIEYAFTNGHAVSKLTQFYYKEDIENIENLIDWDAVKKKYWNDDSDLDLKRRKEAEFLVKGDVPFELLLGFIVYDTDAYTRLSNLIDVSKTKIVVKPEFYF